MGSGGAQRASHSRYSFTARENKPGGAVSFATLRVGQGVTLAKTSGLHGRQA